MVSQVQQIASSAVILLVTKTLKSYLRIYDLIGIKGSYIYTRVKCAIVISMKSITVIKSSVFNFTISG